MNKYEDFLFEINDSFRRREEGLNLSIHETNSIRFEMITEDDEKLEFECVIRIDDINTLDLPILYFKTNQEAQIIDFDHEYEDDQESKQRRESKKIETAKSWLRVKDMENESAAKYELLSRRSPFTFDLFKAKKEQDQSENPSSLKSSGKLPMMFFWLNKPVESVHHKNTSKKINKKNLI